MRLAFGCQARVGKDSACTYLQDKYGGKVYHFSDTLYDILRYAQQAVGIPFSKDVKFLQYVGTEWGRAIDPDIWIKTTMKQLDTCANAFIADVRFPNEIEMLKKNGFKCIRIIRDDRPIDRNTAHPSETALLDYEGWDAVIVNNGSMEEFQRKLDQLVSE